VVTYPKFDTFHQRLRYWREQKFPDKGGQGMLAKAVGIKQSSMSALESGNTKMPMADVFMRLCDALEVRPKYLLFGEGPAQSQHFQELNGLEAQLVMIFRQLPTEGMRDAMLIDANDRLNRVSSPVPSRANPYPTVPPPPLATSKRLKKTT